MGIGISLLNHSGFTGLSALLQDISGVSSMMKSACATHENKQNTRHTKGHGMQRLTVEAVGSQLLRLNMRARSTYTCKEAWLSTDCSCYVPKVALTMLCNQRTSVWHENKQNTRRIKGHGMQRLTVEAVGSQLLRRIMRSRSKHICKGAWLSTVCSCYDPQDSNNHSMYSMHMIWRTN